MKKLIVLLALVSSTAFALPFNADSMTGDKIHFQAESTWVNSYYSKSLCFDGADFHATIQKCAEWTNNDDRRCVRTVMIQATQPQESTRQRCAVRNDDDKACSEWVTVRYFQSENRTIKFLEGDSRRVLGTKKITVPSCN